jgi:hypothetical protein
MSDKTSTTSGNESYEEGDNYYDDLAEEWEGGFVGGAGGGGAKKKKPAKPTTVGRKRVGGSQAWGTSEQVCAKGCAKKCCSGLSKKTPSAL